ncbi:NUDIX hydrolase [Dokdonella sp.]|uniref:NUDIX hydrolase n=1 Tax=Dokdonella sp. TaxID=2291710 RepID=UPI003C358BC1
MLRRKFEDYLGRHPDHMSTAVIFTEFLDQQDCFHRSNRGGHFTGSAWLVSADGLRVLLTHHRKLNRWLQLGGHADGEPDSSLVALQEAREESGLPGLIVEPEIFDLDRHWIPEHGGVPGHWHLDIRHVVRTTRSEEFVVSDESHALAWRDISEIAVDPDADESLRRMALRWLLRQRERREQGMVGA